MVIGIDDAIAGISGAISAVVSRVWPDATQVDMDKLKQFEDGLNAQMAPILAQLDINRTEAASPSVFVAGWRPAIGWVCALGLGYDFLLQPLATPFIGLISHWVGFTLVLPNLDGATVMSLTSSLLGLGAMRSFDYVNGTARQNMNHNPNPPPKTK